MMWYSLFSHTGNETNHLATLHPDTLTACFTTNMEYDGPLRNCQRISSKAAMERLLMQNGTVAPGSLITLNGYMYILSEQLLQYLHSIGCIVLNIHPAPIDKYPELRGRDPQARLLQGFNSGKYACIGVVVHHVDAGVDTGRIIADFRQAPCAPISAATLDQELRLLAVRAWCTVFSMVEERIV